MALQGRAEKLHTGFIYLFIICLFIFTLPHCQQARWHARSHFDRELAFKCGDINVVATRYGPVAV